jgi:hypothetical protein
VHVCPFADTGMRKTVLPTIEEKKGTKDERSVRKVCRRMMSKLEIEWDAVTRTSATRNERECEVKQEQHVHD